MKILQNSLLILVVYLLSLSAYSQPSEGQLAHINGVDFWHMTEGSGEPIFVIPGGPGFSHRYFRPHLEPLSESFKVIYFDAFGRGLSSRASSPSEYSMSRDIEDIEEMRKHLNLKKINLLGHSYGGFVAQAYAIRYPDKIGKLILANTGYSAGMLQDCYDIVYTRVENHYPKRWNRIKHLQGLHDSETSLLVQQEIDSISLPLAYFYNRDYISELGGDEHSFNPIVYKTIAGESAWQLGGSLAEFDFREGLKGLRCPTLIIASRYDLFVPKYSTQYTEFMPHAKFIMIEECGHFPFIEQNEVFSTAIFEFMKK